MPAVTFVDGYPAKPADPDYATQRILDAELRNCHNLRQTHAMPGLLYPGYFSAREKERKSWLEPALRRAAWNADREPWFGYLAGLISLLLGTPPERPPVSDDIFTLLVRLGPRLRGNGTTCHHLPEQLAWSVQSRKAPLSAETRSALHVLVRHLVEIHSHGPGTFDIAWYLWRTADAPVPCFSEMIRREATDKAWSRLWNTRGGTPETIRTAVQAIGPNHFADHWNRWMQKASEHQPAVMSAAGREVLILLLQACRAVPTTPIDDGLYTLCGLRWAGEGNCRLTKEWLGELLYTLAVRPKEKRFACVERLTQNPDVNTFHDVGVTYDHLMSAMTAAEPELASPHRRIEQFLRAVTAKRNAYQNQQWKVDVAWHTEGLQTAIVVADAVTDPAAFLLAISSRRQRNSRPTSADDRFLDDSYPLGDLARQLLETSPSLPPDVTTALIESEARLPSTASTPLFRLVEAHIDTHGYTAPLVDAVRAWHKATHGSHAAMALRHQMGWLLWFEDVTPIKLADCWSNHIRASLRTKPKPVQAAWRKLLENVSFGTGENPPKKWLKPAAVALKALGADEFRTGIREWFEPFRAGQPLRLTVVGRDILRNLLFYTLLAEDPAVDEAIAWFAAAQWKTKKDQSCVAIVLSAFTHVLIERNPELAYDAFARHPLPLAGRNLDRIEALSTRLGRPMPATVAVTPCAIPDPLAAMRKAMTAMLTGPNARLENDELIITGTHDTYTLRIADGGMYRHSDDRPVHIALDMTDQEFVPFQHMIDAMDLQHPFQPNYVRLALCAKVLENDVANVDIIRVDD